MVHYRQQTKKANKNTSLNTVQDKLSIEVTLSLSGRAFNLITFR